MIILSSGPAIVLRFVESFTYDTRIARVLKVRMVSGDTYTITDGKEIDSFITAMKKYHKESGVTDLTK